MEEALKGHISTENLYSEVIVNEEEHYGLLDLDLSFINDMFEKISSAHNQRSTITLRDIQFAVRFTLL
nr:1717_t:CDS:2 [Entrophospora candida]